MQTKLITVQEQTVNAFTNLKIDVYGPREYPIAKNDWDVETSCIKRVDERVIKLITSVGAVYYCGKSEEGQHKFMSKIFKSEEHGPVYKTVLVDAKDLEPETAEAIAKHLKPKILDPFNGWSRDDFIEYLQDQLIPDMIEAGRPATADDFRTAIGFMKMA